MVYSHGSQPVGRGRVTGGSRLDPKTIHRILIVFLVLDFWHLGQTTEPLHPSQMTHTVTQVVHTLATPLPLPFYRHTVEGHAT